MRLYKMIFAAASGIVLCTMMMAGCKKQEVGFLSDRIYYLLNPYPQQQGSTSASASLVVDGSTPPIYVSITSIKDASGKSADSMFLKPQNITTFIDVIDYTDSTLDRMKAKLHDSLVAPFSVNEIGGRLQFSTASQFIDVGSYNLSIKVKNERAEREITNACVLVIKPLSPDTVTYLSWSQEDANGVAQGMPSLPSTDVTYDPSGPTKVVFKWKDVNGHLFNPAAGEVVKRSGRPTFHVWDPYYPEVKTDTSIEYQYPADVPSFPVFLSAPTVEDGRIWTDGICYYQVPKAAIVSGGSTNTVSTVHYNITRGTYTITYNLFNCTRKNTN